MLSDEDASFRCRMMTDIFFLKKLPMGGSRSRTAVLETLRDSRWSEAVWSAGPEDWTAALYKYYEAHQ
jgi:hypothetical protein